MGKLDGPQKHCQPAPRLRPPRSDDETTKVAEPVIEAFECRISIPDDAAVSALQAALEHYGAVFIPEDGGNGAGVRLKFSRSVTKRLSMLEGEGGPAASDDVP